MKSMFWLTLPLLLSAQLAQAHSDANRIEHRWDRRGDRIENRFEHRADRQYALGHEHRGQRLERKGHRIDARFDRIGKRRQARFDRRHG